MKDNRKLQENKVHVDDFKQLKEPTPDIVDTLIILFILGLFMYVGYMMLKSIYTFFFVVNYF